MITPVDEKSEPRYAPMEHRRVSDEEGTVVGEGSFRHTPPREARYRSNSHLTVDVDDHIPLKREPSITSPSQTREEANRLKDDLAMLQIERQVSQQADSPNSLGHSQSMNRSRSRREEPVDEFDVNTNPIHEKAAVYRPPENPSTNLAKIFKKIHQSSFLIRYFFYITPLVVIILIPLLLGALLFQRATVGGVTLLWFSIWLEIVWLCLWAGRILSKCLPWPIGLVSSLFTNNSKKWRDMGKQLEIPATIFFWWLGIEISFLPTMKSHHLNGDSTTREWENTMNKVLVALFVGAVLNFVEKIIIQLIAISFHLRTYQDRIELNKFQINSLTKLYQFSKEQIQMEDSEFEDHHAGPGSGAITPGALVEKAQENTKKAISKFGDVAGKIAGDFTGRQVAGSNHPHQVILVLLNTTGGSQVLARRLYRTFAREETNTVHSDDLKNAFDNDDEAEAAFSMFDKDMNGDISMEELEAVCVEIGRERKSITASLKDLDSVVSKLDDVFMFIVLVITVLVLISLISTSAAGVLTSAGSSVLALSWLFSATAQEFLQSIIFVFVKHPFDVGDRVTVYGNTGSQLKGDDYFVKEISLLFTEFKKLEGHVVQAPNSYLNTLFILNQRRSGGLAEAVAITIKFGTTLEQIDGLRQKLLDFVRAEKREYQGNILTELRDVVEAHAITLNVVFFYKSNWQNELLRLQRRNKFFCAMMCGMQELGIEGPRMRYPGQKQSFPVYLSNVPHVNVPGTGHGGHPDNPHGITDEEPHDPPFVPPGTASSDHSGSAPGQGGSRIRGRSRGESLSQTGKRVDFSLGMSAISSGDLTGDVFEDREKPKIPVSVTSPSRSGRTSRDSKTRSSEDVGRSTSVENKKLQRRGTDMSTRSRTSHRNRFFSRSRNRDGDESRMEEGLADIQEDSGRPTPQRMDPRSGLVSPVAYRLDTTETAASGALRSSDENYRGPRRSATDGSYGR